ncbi:MAG TPA: hypothetical protein VE046_18845 [Steroidobacteraceae bacterium]|nr:hypothetical protein [Steroidobacteraceae bacterium]
MLETPGNWLPARAVLRPDGLYLALRDVGREELRDAFMQETVVRTAASESIVHIARGDIGKAAPDPSPAGLIFHVGRCGSTLISQLLKQHEPLVVYAEPLPVNEILVPPHSWPRHEVVGALRSLGDALARHARGPYVLKLSSWNTLFCDMLVEAFPDSPWILSLRDPVEVGVSILSQRSGWLWDPNGPAGHFASIVDPDRASRSPEDYVARLYGAFCMAAARLDPRRGRLVRYDALPSAVWEFVAPHFSIAIDERQRQRMAQAARNNSKAPPGKAVQFVRDDATKQAAASAELRQAIESFAQPHLEQLRRLHHTSGS